MLVARVVSLSIDRTKPNWGGGGNHAVKNTNTNEIQILFAGYHKPAKLVKQACVDNIFYALTNETRCQMSVRSYKKNSLQQFSDTVMVMGLSYAGAAKPILEDVFSLKANLKKKLVGERRHHCCHDLMRQNVQITLSLLSLDNSEWVYLYIFFL
jgi:hypothetical protein